MLTDEIVRIMRQQLNRGRSAAELARQLAAQRRAVQKDLDLLVSAGTVLRLSPVAGNAALYYLADQQAQALMRYERATTFRPLGQSYLGPWLRQLEESRRRASR